MIRTARSSRWIAFLLLLAAIPAAGAMAETLVPGVSSVAVNDDATAFLVNPAGLCRSVGGAGYFSWDGTEGEDLNVYTGLLATRGFGLGYQAERPEGMARIDRYQIGIGGGARRALTLGTRLTYQRQSSAETVAAWRWDVGLLWRPHPAFSLGTVVRDLTEDAFGEQPNGRTYTAGLGFRPLGGPARTRLTLYADVSGPEDSSWDEDGSLHTGLWVEPLTGLKVGAAYDRPFEDFQDEQTFSLGFALDGVHISALAGILFDHDGKSTRTSGAIQMVGARQKTMLREPTYTQTKIAGAYGDEAQGGLPIPLIGAESVASVRPVLRELENAAKDPNVRGVLLDLSPTSAGALSEEIHDRILRIRKEGKPVVDVDGRKVIDDGKPYREGMAFRCNLDGSELEDCRWFSRDEVALMLREEHPDGVKCPPSKAIASFLIRAWAEG